MGQRYGGMEVSELKRIKELEEENARFKPLYQPCDGVRCSQIHY